MQGRDRAKGRVRVKVRMKVRVGVRGVLLGSHVHVGLGLG